MYIDELLSIPYKKNGRTLMGADCWGFTVIVEREIFRKNLPKWDIDEDFDIEKAKKDFIEVEAPRDGDIALMRSSVSIAHTGVFINNRIYHMTERGVCASNTKAISPLILGVYRFEH